jgi:interferon-induced GTP-binding protein Mx1
LEDVNLPQIAVVGDQSSGKSSVLSGLAADFQFPSASTLATRCATSVIMSRSEVSSSCVYSSLAPQKKQIDSIHEAIENLTQELVSKSKDGEKLTKETISVELAGKDMPDLTLIDLPGLFKATLVDQSAVDVETARELSETYISQVGRIYSCYIFFF